VNLVEPHIASFFGLHLPPSVALFLTVAFIVFLFRRDIREKHNVTGALWLPVLWVLLIGSRSVAQWLHVFGAMSLGSVEEGSPLDALIYFSLIIAGLCVLNQRKVSLGEIFRENRWLMAFLLYCFIAILWSDFPFVAFKRWIKILGHPIMVLILFTEPDPGEALARLMKRSAYVLVTFSVLLIKYYPDIGRGFEPWTGLAMNMGVAQSKNMLGCLCLVLGFFFFWHFLRTWRSPRDTARRDELRLVAAFLVMIGWLLWKAQSATSLLSLLIGIVVMLLVERRWVNKKLIGTYAILAVIVLMVAELAFGIFERVVDLSGHSSTVIGRVELWRDLLALHTNPIFGVGFESFWLGDRLANLWETRWWHPNEAHNGYLDLYLDLGLVGLFMLVGIIIATFRKIRLELLRNLEWGQFRLGFLVAVIFYNCTEATFKGLSLVWFVFYIIVMEYPSLRVAPREASFEAIGSEEEMELVYFPDTVHNQQSRLAG
jgi:exopolysaccharide production protein ExoQ